MKELKLTQGMVALVDDEDFELVSQYNWSAAKGRHTYYAEQKRRLKHRHMHRLIMDTPVGMTVDHLDGNGLNNQKSNLRNCSPTQNCQNRVHRNSSKYGYQGVTDKGKNKFYAYIRYKTKLTHLGVYSSASLAAEAYNKKAIELYGSDAKLNIIVEDSKL